MRESVRWSHGLRLQPCFATLGCLLRGGGAILMYSQVLTGIPSPAVTSEGSCGGRCLALGGLWAPLLNVTCVPCVACRAVG